MKTKEGYFIIFELGFLFSVWKHNHNLKVESLFRFEVKPVCLVFVISFSCH